MERTRVKDHLIVEAARKIFARKGYHKATISEIATAANLGKGTIYWYFKGKDSLSYTLVEEGISAIEDTIFGRVRITEDPVEKLRVFSQVVFQLAETDPDFMRIFKLFLENVALGNRRLELRLKKMYVTWQRVIVDILVEGINQGKIRSDLDLKNTASLALALMDGIIIQWLVNRQDTSFISICQAMEDVFIKGLRA